MLLAPPSLLGTRLLLLLTPFVLLLHLKTIKLSTPFFLILATLSHPLLLRILAFSRPSLTCRLLLVSFFFVFFIATSLFDRMTGSPLFGRIWYGVWWFSHHYSLSFWKSPFELDPLALSWNRHRWISVAGKFFSSIWILGLFLKKALTIADVGIIGFCDVQRSTFHPYQSQFLARKKDRFLTFLSTTTLLSGLSLSFMVPIIRSTFPLPLWSLIGLTTCFI